MGIGALVYFKYVKGRSFPIVVERASAVPSLLPSARPDAPSVAAASSANDVYIPSRPGGGPASAATPALTAPSALPLPKAVAVVVASPSPAPKELGREEPGYLTVVCNPSCDDIVDQGRSIGPSPIVHMTTKPGAHRITLTKGSASRIMSVIVVSGQETPLRVSMQ